MFTYYSPLNNKFYLVTVVFLSPMNEDDQKVCMAS